MMSLSFPSFLLLIIGIASTAEAFAPQRCDTHPFVSHSKVTPCFLLPCQAADLEACAYDLMKEALEEKAKVSDDEGALNSSISVDISRKLAMDSKHVGPVSWAKRKLWPFNTERLP
jgi:hypothetical protein